MQKSLLDVCVHWKSRSACAQFNQDLHYTLTKSLAIVKYTQRLQGSWYDCNDKQAEMILNPCHAELIKMPHPFLIFSQSYYLIQIIDINSHT